MSAHCFKRSQRLLTPAQFRRVFAEQSLRSVDNSLTILAAPNNCGYPRLGLALAKKQLKRAVDRNRCKRVIRQSFRYQQGQLPAIDIVVLARSELVHTDKAQLHAKLARHWQRLNQRWEKVANELANPSSAQ